ncbi:diacylglycerol/polyprenol kinase family protein [Sediminispirochaeta smaragdinae]|uniref:Phosphatidate cytidylyltransferase n=1 Tax=Sediminispirochaeta smaragdinae (strain DSM 11293 / JCM 15392 / SEBR 4228) TaxID=573413 RepID=E1RAC2_SEDSS|nr:phosphatidate cytidylyltransferase [Sediminispirochaeta smaragdinae]ADK79413.1 phosphatidate cytidylyltransferase [Sediminispirochaeta smaragdinae DSM 11293]
MRTTFQGDTEKIRTEIIRKSIHMMVAFVPAFARINIGLTMALLAASVVAYSVAELLRVNGKKIFLISTITEAANRNRNNSAFVFGPVTLALGAMMTLLLYPSQVAAIAVYALAFGDGFSSLFGRLYGRVRVPFTEGKTFAGSFACLLAVFFSSLSVSGNIEQSVLIAIAATLLEISISGDLDNLVLPIGTGFVAWLVGVGI